MSDGRPRWVTLEMEKDFDHDGVTYEVRIEVDDLGPHGYQPGQRVTVMPAEDAEEMLRLIESVASLKQGPVGVVASARLLLARLRSRR